MGFSMERPQYPGSSVCLLYTDEQGDEAHLDWRSLGRGAVSGYKQDQRGRKLQQVFFVLSVGTGSWTQGRLCRSSLCATLMGLRHRGPRHDSARVNHTCKLRMSLTRCTLFSNPFLKLEPLTASIPQEMQAAGHPSVGPKRPTMNP